MADPFEGPARCHQRKHRAVLQRALEQRLGSRPMGPSIVQHHEDLLHEPPLGSTLTLTPIVQAPKGRFKRNPAELPGTPHRNFLKGFRVEPPRETPTLARAKAVVKAKQAAEKPFAGRSLTLDDFNFARPRSGASQRQAGAVRPATEFGDLVERLRERYRRRDSYVMTDYDAEAEKRAEAEILAMRARARREAASRESQRTRDRKRAGALNVNKVATGVLLHDHNLKEAVAGVHGGVWKEEGQGHDELAPLGLPNGDDDDLDSPAAITKRRRQRQATRVSRAKQESRKQAEEAKSRTEKGLARRRRRHQGALAEAAEEAEAEAEAEDEEEQAERQEREKEKDEDDEKKKKEDDGDRLAHMADIVELVDAERFDAAHRMAQAYGMPDLVAKLLWELQPDLRSDSVVQQLIQSVNTLHFFGTLDPEIVTRLCAQMELRSFAAGTYVFQQGDVGEFLYVIYRGSVAILVRDGITHQEKKVATLETGQVFGDIALRNANARRTASVLIDQKSELLLLPNAQYSAILGEHEEKLCKQRLQTLSICPVFSQWPPDRLLKLAKVAVIRHYHPYQTLLAQGERAEELAVIRRGVCRVVKRVAVHKRLRVKARETYPGFGDWHLPPPDPRYPRGTLPPEVPGMWIVEGLQQEVSDAAANGEGTDEAAAAAAANPNMIVSDTVVSHLASGEVFGEHVLLDAHGCSRVSIVSDTVVELVLLRRQDLVTLNAQFVAGTMTSLQRSHNLHNPPTERLLQLCRNRQQWDALQQRLVREARAKKNPGFREAVEESAAKRNGHEEEY